MKSLVRFLIGFVLIYQLLPAECKVIKKQSVYGSGIRAGPVELTHFDVLYASQEGINVTSIKDSNVTQSNGPDVDSSAHQMWVTECFH